MPGEQEQFLAYREVVEAMAPAPVIIRTLDLGGDKAMVSNPDLFPKENNPFMGFRAIRFCLENPEIFRQQLCAILRASAFGRVKPMYPMISGSEELRRANAVLEECKRELRQRGDKFDESIEAGAMIEIPSAATTADLLARDCRFFSIGTNDLIQYLLAIDRVNERIAHLYEPTHPAVVRTVRLIVDEAHRQGVPVGVCGEMAGDPVFVPLLLGLGVDSLSMSPAWLPAVKYLVRGMTMADARALAAEALTLSSAKEIYARCDAFYRSRVKME
jgi:phosphotransferase system enzyme I (PtsI)